MGSRECEEEEEGDDEEKVAVQPPLPPLALQRWWGEGQDGAQWRLGTPRSGSSAKSPISPSAHHTDRNTLLS